MATDPALLHFDYRPANLLVREGAIAAVLDWGLAIVGDPAYDLFNFEKNVLVAQRASLVAPARAREAIRRGYRDADTTSTVIGASARSRSTMFSERT